MSRPVWLITGCSSGFGTSLALIALKSGHRVIATSRDPSKTPDVVAQVEQLGGTWQKLDVASPEPEIVEAIEKAKSVYGGVDILVNSAGYALLGAFETISDKESRAQMETNFFGPMTIIRAILPSMRKRKSGTIVNISSTAGIEARASRSIYSASKWALEAISESLSEELKSFGVGVLIVSPAGFRTNFATSFVSPENTMPEQYRGTITDQMIESVKEMASGAAAGDVEKGCQAIFDVVTKSGQFNGMDEHLRLPLGKDGIARWKIKIDELQRTMEGTEKIWSSTDADT